MASAGHSGRHLGRLGLGKFDLSGRQVDPRARIAQIPLAHAIVQMHDPMDPRVVRDRELAELRIDTDLVAKALVELFHRVSLVTRDLLSFLEFDLRKWRAEMLGGLDPDDLAGSQVDGGKDREIVEIAIGCHDCTRARNRSVLFFCLVLFPVILFRNFRVGRIGLRGGRRLVGGGRLGQAAGLQLDSDHIFSHIGAGG